MKVGRRCKGVTLCWSLATRHGAALTPYFAV
jgi:hypothetical protein